MDKNYPWTTDENGLPVLDTADKLTAYAAAVLHQPARLNLINYTPRDLETVSLYYGLSKKQTCEKYQEAMKKARRGSEYLDNFSDILNIHNQEQLGIVNGIAADTLNRLRAQDSL